MIHQVLKIKAYLSDETSYIRIKEGLRAEDSRGWSN